MSILQIAPALIMQQRILKIRRAKNYSRSLKRFVSGMDANLFFVKTNPYYDSLPVLLKVKVVFTSVFLPFTSNTG